MNTAAEVRPNLPPPTRAFAVVLLAAAVLDISLPLAVLADWLNGAEATALHLALVVGLGAVLSAGSWHQHGDIALMAILTMVFAGPLGPLAALGVMLSQESKRLTANASDSAYNVDQAIDPVERLVADLRSGRCLAGTTPLPTSLLRILQDGTVADQLAVLKVVAQKYEPQHRQLLSIALRAKAGGVRAQAAALVTTLAVRVKQRFDAAISANKAGALEPYAAVAELLACLRSGLLEPAQATAARETALAICKSPASQTSGQTASAFAARLLEIEDFEPTPERAEFGVSAKVRTASVLVWGGRGVPC